MLKKTSLNTEINFRLLLSLLDFFTTSNHFLSVIKFLGQNYVHFNYRINFYIKQIAYFDESKSAQAIQLNLEYRLTTFRQTSNDIHSGVELLFQRHFRTKKLSQSQNITKYTLHFGLRKITCLHE